MKAIKIGLIPYIDLAVINVDVFGNVIKVNVKRRKKSQKQIIFFMVGLMWINFISINVLVVGI